MNFSINLGVQTFRYSYKQNLLSQLEKLVDKYSQEEDMRYQSIKIDNFRCYKKKAELIFPKTINYL